jgi:hypothetical protein
MCCTLGRIMVTVPFPHSVRRLILPVLGGVAWALLSAAGCKRAETTASPADAPSSAATAAAMADTSAMDRLKGRWLRPDGGYVLAIGSIDEGGRAEAGYFNPNPIRVAWAMVRPEGDGLKLEVELRDQNYPGCLYKLKYNPEKDHLVGTYFQAQAQQTYDVEFVRTP